MRYRLGEHLSYCEVEDRWIFLDVSQDRYFMLQEALGAAFRTLRAGGHPTKKHIDKLLESGILAHSQDGKHDIRNVEIRIPDRSALELTSPSHSHPSPRMLLEVLAIVLWTRWQLAYRPLSTILANAESWNFNDACMLGSADLAATEDRFAVASAQFRQARRYTPVEPSCLLDSLSLAYFLARRGLAADIVLGVTLRPFAAHCWVQTRNLILNETASDAHAHTPIKVIR